MNTLDIRWITLPASLLAVVAVTAATGCSAEPGAVGSSTQAFAFCDPTHCTYSPSSGCDCSDPDPCAADPAACFCSAHPADPSCEPDPPCEASSSCPVDPGGDGLGTWSQYCTMPFGPLEESAVVTPLEQCLQQWGGATALKIPAGGYESGANASETAALRAALARNIEEDNTTCTKGKKAIGAQTTYLSVNSARALTTESKVCVAMCAAAKAITYLSSPGLEPPTDVYVQSSAPFHTAHTPVSALLTGQSNCVGYSSYASAMLTALGVPNAVVAGTVGSERHAWVAVEIGGQQYYIEPQAMEKASDKCVLMQ